MRQGNAEIAARIKQVGAVAILRTLTSDQALRAAEAAIAGGFGVVEITYGVPDAPKVIEQLVRENSSVLFGAGTVLTRAESLRAADAGAQFLVSPCVIPEMIEAARERNVAAIPGAFTPTEIYTAWSLGADIIKLFPAIVNGPEYLRTVRGPLPHIPIMPTSGVNSSNVADWFQAGAVAVGAVSSVFDPALVQQGDWAGLTKRSREFLQAVQRAREAR